MPRVKRSHRFVARGLMLGVRDSNWVSYTQDRDNCFSSVVGQFQQLVASVEDCDFCRIVARQMPARIVLETEDVLAFFPRRPATPGHTLVIPKRHTQDLWSITDLQITAVVLASKVVANAIRAALSPEGVNLINSSGRAASQTVMHFHMHVVPRWEGDAMGEIWPKGDCVSESRKEELAELLCDACAGLLL